MICDQLAMRVVTFLPQWEDAIYGACFLVYGWSLLWSLVWRHQQQAAAAQLPAAGTLGINQPRWPGISWAAVFNPVSGDSGGGSVWWQRAQRVAYCLMSLAFWAAAVERVLAPIARAGRRSGRLRNLPDALLSVLPHLVVVVLSLEVWVWQSLSDMVAAAHGISLLPRLRTLLPPPGPADCWPLFILRSQVHLTVMSVSGCHSCCWCPMQLASYLLGCTKLAATFPAASPPCLCQYRPPCLPSPIDMRWPLACLPGHPLSSQLSNLQPEDLGMGPPPYLLSYGMRVLTLTEDAMFSGTHSSLERPAEEAISFCEPLMLVASKLPCPMLPPGAYMRISNSMLATATVTQRTFSLLVVTSTPPTWH